MIMQMQSLLKEKVSLLELWEERKVQFEQCMELQLFLRDAFQADNWMAKQEVNNLCRNRQVPQ
jgi:spectrin alpha